LVIGKATGSTMINRFLALLSILFGLSLSASIKAQIKLSPCPAVDYSKNTHLGAGGRTEKWHNCFGRYVLELNDGFKGNIYEGEFKNGKPNGWGTLHHLADNPSKGDKYEGEFREGKYNGKGKYIYRNGDQYVGEFKDDKRHGLGTHNFFSGGKYIGEYKDNFENGKGTYFLANGSKYVGEFKEFKYDGQGTYTYSNGDKYVGGWKEDKYDGLGTFTFADGRVQEGIWVDGKFVRAEQVNLPLVQQQSDVAIKELRRKLSTDRLELEAERQRFTEDRNQREQTKLSSKLSLQTTTTNPDANGVVIIIVRTNVDTSSLKVNGEEQGGRPDGNYTIKRVARVGQDTQFTITAIDIIGNTDSKTITVSRKTVESTAVAATLNPENIKSKSSLDAVAVIIGISNYKSLPRADFAKDDAQVFYDYAIRALGIKPENIKLLLDADAEEVEIFKAFKTWLPARVKSTTDVYVFYSGHGLPTSDGLGLYLLPYRADRDLISKTAVQFQEINSDIQAAKPKSVTIFMDACYSGQARGGETLIASARPLALKAQTTIFPSGFNVFSASHSDQISSSSPDLKHGIFSYYLMKGMEGDADANKDGKITLGEMQGYLAENVGRQAGMMNRKQEPQLIGDSSRVLVGR
jgi:hypothetical protein